MNQDLRGIASAGGILRAAIARDAAGEPMVVDGLVVPYDVWTKGQAIQRRFKAGAFGAFQGFECPVLVAHDGGRTVVGVATCWDSPAGLRTRIAMADTPAGRAAWGRVVAGELRGLSMSGTSECETRVVDGVERRLTDKVDAIREVSLVPRGAFPDACIWRFGRAAAGELAGPEPATVGRGAASAERRAAARERLEVRRAAWRARERKEKRHVRQLQAHDERADRELDASAELMHAELAAIPENDMGRRVEVMQVRLARSAAIWERHDQARAELQRRQVQEMGVSR